LGWGTKQEAKAEGLGSWLGLTKKKTSVTGSTTVSIEAPASESVEEAFAEPPPGEGEIAEEAFQEEASRYQEAEQASVIVLASGGTGEEAAEAAAEAVRRSGGSVQAQAAAAGIAMEAAGGTADDIVSAATQVPHKCSHRGCVRCGVCVCWVMAAA